MRKTLALCLLLGPACTEKKKSSAPPEPSTFAAPALAPPKDVEPLPPLPDPVARVGEVEISRADFEARFEEVLNRYRRARSELRGDLEARLRSNLVRRLVEAEVIRQKAVELGVEPGEAELEAAWTSHKATYGSDEAFEIFAKRSGSSEAGLRARFVENLRRSRVIEAGVETKAPTVAEMRAFYDSHPGYFDRPAEARVRQLLFRFGPGDDGQQRTRAAAEKGLAALRRGSSFEEVFEQAFPGSADARKGDLGFVPRHRLPEPVAKVVFDELKTGQLSGIIETRYGLHIVRKEGSKPERTLDFDEARPIIEQRMLAQRRNRDVRNALEAWKKAADAEAFTGDELTGTVNLQPELMAPRRLGLPAAGTAEPQPLQTPR